MRNLFNLVLFLLSLNCFTQNLGCWPASECRLFGLLLLIGLFLLNLPLDKKISSWREFGIGTLLLMASLFVLLKSVGTLWWLISVIGMLLSFDLVFQGFGARFERISLYVMTVFLYLLFLLLFRSLHLLWYVSQWYSLWVSKWVGDILLDTNLSVGISGSGFWVCVVFLCYFTAAIFLSGERSWRFLYVLPALFLAQVIYLIFQSLFQFPIPSNATGVVNTQWLVFLLGSVPIVLLSRNIHLPQGLWNLNRGLRRALIILLTGFFLAVVFLSIFPVIGADRPGKILCSNEGFLDWDVPVFGKYGALQTGMFGMLPKYLAAQGYQTEQRDRPLTVQSLKDKDVLVIINPQQLWPPEEMEAVWDFVRRGGSLLVLGDHTDIKGTRASLNQLLAPASISFNFDSAYPCRHGWFHCQEFFDHPLNYGVYTALQPMISIGASLSASPPAYPVITGKYGFSDLGNVLNAYGAYLGNYSYERGEQLGDVILAAGLRHGKGKVLVFGDTSPVQNGALPFSFVPFTQNMFKWLSHKEKLQTTYLKPIGWLLMGSSLFIFLKRFRRSLIVLGISGATIALSLLMVDTWNGLVMTHEAPRGPFALVDLSHGERSDLAPFQKNSVGGCLASLIRNGYWPLFIDQLSEKELALGKMLVMIAPSQPFSKSEIDYVGQFMQKGGLILLAVGWEEKEASEKFLKSMKIDIIPVPLGPVPYLKEKNPPANQPQFVSAWPIMDLSSFSKEPTRTAEAVSPSYLVPSLPKPAPPQDIGMALEFRYRIPQPVLGKQPLSIPDIDALVGTSNRPYSQKRAALPSGRTTTNPLPMLEEGHSGKETNDFYVCYQADGYPMVVLKKHGKGGLLLIGDTYFLGEQNMESLSTYSENNILFLRELFTKVKQKVDSQ
jgi:hypothetical protein